MSFRWPNKDPDELLDYSIDWSRFLGTSSINTIDWFIHDSSNSSTSQTILPGETKNGIKLVAKTNTSTVATINLQLGTVNTEYKFTCRMIDNNGHIAERSVKLRIRNK